MIFDFPQIGMVLVHMSIDLLSYFIQNFIIIFTEFVINEKFTFFDELVELIHSVHFLHMNYT